MTSLYCVMSTVFRDQMYHPVYQKSAFLWHLWDMSCLKFQTNINTRCEIQCYVDRDIFISTRADRQTDSLAVSPSTLYLYQGQSDHRWRRYPRSNCKGLITPMRWDACNLRRILPSLWVFLCTIILTHSRATCHEIPRFEVLIFPLRHRRHMSVDP